MRERKFNRQWQVDPVARECALARANNRCEWMDMNGKRCINTKSLHMHHLTYQREGREYVTDLITLCPSHHHIADIIRKVSEGLDTNVIHDHFFENVIYTLGRIKNDDVCLTYLRRTNRFINDAYLELKNASDALVCNMVEWSHWLVVSDYHPDECLEGIERQAYLSSLSAVLDYDKQIRRWNENSCIKEASMVQQLCVLESIKDTMSNLVFRLDAEFTGMQPSLF